MREIYIATLELLFGIVADFHEQYTCTGLEPSSAAIKEYTWARERGERIGKRFSSRYPND